MDLIVLRLVAFFHVQLVLMIKIPVRAVYKMLAYQYRILFIFMVKLVEKHAQQVTTKTLWTFAKNALIHAIHAYSMQQIVLHAWKTLKLHSSTHMIWNAIQVVLLVHIHPKWIKCVSPAPKIAKNVYQNQINVLSVANLSSFGTTNVSNNVRM